MMENQEGQPPAEVHSPTWPPAPTQRPALKVVKTHYQEWSYLTGFMAGDLLLGLLAGAAAHFLSWVAFGIVAEIIVPVHPTPAPLWYGSWVFAVVVAVLLVVLFFRRCPALMTAFIISTVPVAAINLAMLWFGSALAGR